jgi:hypothetical protein
VRSTRIVRSSPQLHVMFGCSHLHTPNGTESQARRAMHGHGCARASSESTFTFARLAESKSARMLSFPAFHRWAASSGSGCGQVAGARGRSSNTVRNRGGKSLRPTPRPAADPTLAPVVFPLPPVPPPQSGRPPLVLVLVLVRCCTCEGASSPVRRVVLNIRKILVNCGTSMARVQCAE